MAEKSSSGFRNDEDNDWSIPPQSPEVQSLFQNAKKYYEAKKYDVALALYGVILDKAQTDDSPASVYGFIKSLYMISRCHMEKDDYEQAIGVIDLVSDLILSNCPDKIHIPEQLIMEIEERRGNIIGAFILALIFKELHPTIKQCKEHLSYIQEKVEDSFAESRSNMSKVFLVLTEKGKECYKKDEYSTAAAFFEKVVEIFHFLPDENLQMAYIWQAKCLLKMDRLDEAEGVVTKVLVRFPSHTKARKLHQKIKEAKGATSEKRNTGHHLPEKKGRNEDVNRSDAGAASTHRSDEKNSTGSPVVSEPGSRSTRTSQEPLKNESNKHNSSFKSNERNTALDSFSYEASAAPLRDSPTSAASKQTDNVEKDSEYAMGSGNKITSNDADEIALLDEAQFQTVKSRKKTVKKAVKTDTSSLPEGVEIICEHFEKEVFAHPQKGSQIDKVCASCKRSTSRLKYAFWSKEFKEWRNVRSIPSNIRQTVTQIRRCHHFQSGQKCIKCCTFAHGPEIHMWDLERKGDLPSPETYLKNKRTSKEDAKASNPPAKIVAPPDNAMHKTEDKSTAQHKYTTTIPVRQNWESSEMRYIQCFLPPEVKIVCDDFIKKFGSLRIGVGQRTNVCKNCGEKCRRGDPFATYAFWSEGFKRWFTVRPFPRNIHRVAFKSCRDFILNKRCLKNPCTFAHGPELTMWTLEREGTLFPAWKALSLNIVDATDYQHSGVNVRPLPIGTLPSDLKLCKSVTSRVVCRYGRGCRFPHSKHELDAWRKSYGEKLRGLKEAKTRDEKGSVKHYELEFADSIPGVVLSSIPVDPNVQLAEDCDNHTYTWKFCARFEMKTGLPAVELQSHRHIFHFTEMQVVGLDNNNRAVEMLSKELNACRIPREQLVFDSKMKMIEFRVTVSFQASVFGSFTQRILFEFFGQPLLKKEFNIDVGSKETLDKLTDVRRLAVNLETRPWDNKDMEIIRCDPDPEKDRLMSTYSLPKNAERLVSAQLVEGEIRRDTYKQTMHQLLFTEEHHMNELLSSLTPKTVKLQAMKRIDLGDDGMLAAVDGQLLGLIELDCNKITPDDMAGRVCLRNVQTIWVQSRDKSTCRYELPSITENGKKKSLIYSGNKIVVTLTPKICKDLKIKDESIVDVEMRFNLNRVILCLMHKAVDSLGNTQAQQLFPVEQLIIRRKMINIWEWFVDPRLNECQKRVIQAITEVVPPSPPLVVFGPFGTGKTFTLNQAVTHLMREKANRVLLCTHTNSAADIHVEMLDEYLGGNAQIVHAAKPLRIYALETQVERTSIIAQKYALIKDGAFLMPTRRNVIDHRVVITTLVSAELLTKLNVHRGFFTHILIDEAAQTWETESLIPLALAGPNTKIVFTGDHMQMSPEVYSPFARQWGLQRSLPERLFDDYQWKDEVFRNEQVLFLYENYRVNAEILKFPSDNCYGGEIVAKGNVPAHPELPPLIFYSSKGKDEKQSDNSYLNSSEVYEVVKRVGELIKKWPQCWGRENQREIAVVAPYKYQINAIRGELRRKRMGAVKVETIHNVQGREYRALFISTVRTWKSIEDSPNQSSEELSLEFLSDPKLLITAVTRAKSLVAVVGDPFALCTLGKCAYLWNDYISRCYWLNGLIGTTWEELSGDIEAHFSTIQLNPEAPSFVPKSGTQENDTKEEQHSDVENATDQSDTHESTASSSISIRNNDTPIEEEQEDNGDQASSYSDDFQDGSTADDDNYGCAEEDLEDEAVLNMDIDRIIEELCKFIKTRQTLQQNALPDEEFPALTKCPSKVKETPKWPSVSPNQSLNFESLRGNYQIHTRYGRTEIQLLDIYDRPSERVQQIFMNNYRQQNFEPEVLMHMLENDPSRFHAGQLHIRNERSRTAYLVIPDKEKPDIEVKGSIKHAFDLDTVVVEVQQSRDQEENRGFGILVGVLNHIMSPRERQYVCKVDRRNPSLMRPINKSVTIIVNLSDKMIKDTIPIYKKRKTLEEKAGRPMKIMTMTTNEAKEKKCLFVVEFLQWRNDCSLPLGIAVRTIPMGDTMEHCKQILFAECGIRKSFSKSIKENIKESFPPTLKIPDSELKYRKRISDAFTIDPPESRDLDDAISIERTQDGNFKVGIHIADVSFHVSRGSELDREARQRGVSYYPDVEEEDNIPMFPTELSENLFSLLPNKDRLTVSVFVTLNGEGEVISNRPEILRTVTRSCCRLNYSQAQEIIDAENRSSVNVDIPHCVCQAILLIYPLISKMRSLRLREASLDHSSNRENTDAHELIEELMILANHTVGDFLASRNAGVAPFRTQLEPKVHRLNEWVTHYGSLAKCFPALLPHLRSQDITTESKERMDKEEEEIEIQEHFWDQICKAADKGNHREVERLICDPLCSPQLAVVRLQLIRIQTKSQYNCSDDTKHHSLGLRNYVHFTSPIRRYIDIEVHRLLLTLIPGNGPKESTKLDQDEMGMLCRRSTYFKDTSDKFSKEFKRIHFASSLKHKNQVGVFFIDSLENRFFTIHPVSPDQDLFLGKHKRIKFDDLSPYCKSDSHNGKPETTLKWRLRIYIGHSPKSDSQDSPSQDSTDECSASTRLEDANKLKKVIVGGSSRADHGVHKIEGKTWLRMIDALKKSRPDELLRQIKYTENKLKAKEIAVEKDPVRSRSRDIYKHPNFGRLDDTVDSDSDGHFHEITMNLKQFDMVDFQISSQLYRGMLCPNVQLFRVSSGLCICLEHRRNPCRCFALDTQQHASKVKYESIDEYIRFWSPALAMEAASSAIAQSDGFILKSLPVKWSQKDGTTKGKFSLINSYCKSRQIELHYGDLACVKIPILETLEPEARVATKEVRMWIGHGIVQMPEAKELNDPSKNRISVTVKIHQMASEFPQELLNTTKRDCEVEIIYQPLPLRRMIEALNCNLENSSDLVQAICLGVSSSNETFPCTGEQLSLALHYKTSPFHPLNKYQEQAVQQALTRPFSLIQGPPGTGKTVTGVHIAYWFAKQNQKLKSTMKPEDKVKTSEGDASEGKAPPQVLYCGPSNKSVDVVTEYLLRIPGMKDKILRVHGNLIEESEFPIPNKIRLSIPKVSEEELKIPGQKVKEVSLHHFIRSSSSPYSGKLKAMEDQFKEATKRRESPSDEDVAKYCEIINEAEEWAIQRSGKEIILCTCSRAGSKTITQNCDNIQQCIIDECGMCMEPEVLVPLTSSMAKQFVLIGDHKQLQPIVTDKRARRLGLEVSMFERLAKQAFMLKIQYRMHPSICEFPSRHFYNNELETQGSVKSRKSANVKIWPARGRTAVFCHVEGVEESTVISTAESGVESKYNEKEARKVAQVAKYLVNKYDINRKDIVILTPYRQQHKVIKKQLKAAYDDIHVTTIIKSQGSEWDYVILSLVRSLPEVDFEPEPSSSWLAEHLGFIADDHQINVALTRAKHGLCIIGNKNLLSYNPTWSSLIKRYDETNCVVSDPWPCECDEYQQN